jgi:hypothetical protein
MNSGAKLMRRPRRCLNNRSIFHDFFNTPPAVYASLDRYATEIFQNIGMKLPAAFGNWISAVPLQSDGVLKNRIKSFHQQK